MPRPSNTEKRQAQITGALVKVLAIPEVRERFASGGVVATASRTPEDFAAYVSAESERWGNCYQEIERIMPPWKKTGFTPSPLI